MRPREPTPERAVVLRDGEGEVVKEAYRLYEACQQVGVGGKVEATYDPADGVAILMLYDVTDESFPPEGDLDVGLAPR